MKVQVLFFGATAETMGETEIGFDFESGTKAGEAFEKILSVFPPLRRHSLLFAVNEEYARGGETIKDGDELAIFTAVSGG